jgi:competence protein ComEC
MFGFLFWNPVFWVLMPFMCGIAFVLYAGIAFPLAVALLPLALCALWWCFGRNRLHPFWRKLWALGAVGFFFVFGNALAAVALVDALKGHRACSHGLVTVSGRLSTAVQHPGGKARFFMTLLKGSGREGETCLVQLGKPCAPLPKGTWVEVRGNYAAVPIEGNPGGFRYDRFLWQRNVVHRISALEVRKLPRPRTMTVEAYAQDARSHLLSLLEPQKLSPHHHHLLSALVLGFSEDLEEDILDRFSATGVMHILSVSGFHLGIIFLLLSRILKPLERRQNGKWPAWILCNFTIWSYALLTGFSASVVRSAFMCSVLGLGKMMKRPAPPMHALVLSAFVLLLYNPLYLADIGFQLSYLALLGILLTSPIVDPVLRQKGRVVAWVGGLTISSLAATLSTLPLTLLYFHRFPLFFILGNLIAVPLSSLLIYGGCFFLVGLQFALPMRWFQFLLEGVMEVFDYSMKIIAALPGSDLRGLPWSALESVLLAAFAVVLFVLLEKPLARIAMVGSALLVALLGAGLWLDWRSASVPRMGALKLSGMETFWYCQNRQVHYLVVEGPRAQPQRWQQAVANCQTYLRCPKAHHTLLQDGFAYGDGSPILLVSLQGLKEAWQEPASKQAWKVCLVHGSGRLPRGLPKARNLQTVILGNTLSRRMQAELRKELTALGYSVHSLAEQGAWQSHSSP